MRGCFLPRVIALSALATCALAPETASAQPAPMQGDVAGHMGWAAERPEDQSQWNHWHHSFLLDAEAGFYWTEHLRTALDVTWTPERETALLRPANVPGAPWATVYSELHVGHTQVGLGQQFQFFSNTWVHPYAGGGVLLDFERTRSFTPRQVQPAVYPAGVQSGGWVVIAEESNSGPDTRLVVRPFVSGGAKFYLSPRVFFRTDVRWAGHDTSQLTTRFGFGTDW